MATLTTLIDNTVPVAADFNANFVALNNEVRPISTGGTGISAYVAGDLIYASAPTTLSRINVGAKYQVLGVNDSTLPAWVSLLTNQIAGLTLSNNVADATNDIDIALGAAVSNDAALADRTMMALTAAITKQLDAAWAVGSAAGMLATGVAVTDTTYHLFLIKRPDTGVVDVAADTSATGANVATNTNAAYTKLRRIGSIIRASGAIVGFTQQGDEFLRKVPINDYQSANPGTSAVTRAIGVPTGVKVTALHHVAIADTDGGDAIYGLITSLDTTDTVPSATLRNVTAHLAGATGHSNGNNVVVRTDTSAQIRTRLSASAAAISITGTTLGWIDRRGRDD